MSRRYLIRKPTKIFCKRCGARLLWKDIDVDTRIKIDARTGAEHPCNCRPRYAKEPTATGNDGMDAYDAG